ncbi:pimeloyl-ACP methyl ester carboxylesterase [Isoptericola sp. CG 20/1183]|uniref:Pimeloyl-ACP methyl ester carboxylesterase n=1 Tax=Isoptericola halotolerans TaxID=300560 RepID=A0ABX5EB27_9MICO|nr:MULTISPECIES: alpha/beta fold hydrolase [Isoptericola]PRZ04477.1 pimeloyl-ACP methyl ester carboxylesterase [Isoptericola halotolerans]PRZ04625.1 pimeloyl-ACP methyl ester carboxylesterase [Isoptericola sp. CG 20/1183]
MILTHDDAGTGPAVLLIHAGVADRRMWDPLVPALSHAFRVIRPDLRGFGETPLPGGEYADADDLAVLLDHLDVADVAVVGSSFGGRVALELATTHPGRVRELVLLNPDLRGVEPSATAAAFDTEEDRLLAAGDLEGAVRLNVDTWLGPAADLSVREALAAMQRRAFEVQLAADASDDPPAPRRIEVDLAAVAVPTVVVTGAHDMDHFRAVAARVGDGIEGAELVELDRAGHLPALELPDAVRALLLDVLRADPTVHAP